MPTASRNVRKLRRIKRERTLAFQSADFLQRERDQARMIGRALEMELRRISEATTPELLKDFFADESKIKDFSNHLKNHGIPKGPDDGTEEDVDHTESIEVAQDLAARDE